MREDLRTVFNTRQYMLSKDYEIYYYSDIHMQGTGMHTHDYYEFYIFIAGDVSIVIGKNTYKLSTGDLVLIPPGMPHHALIHDPNKYYQRFVFWISADLLNRMLSDSPNYGYVIQRATVSHQYIQHFEGIQFNALQSKVFAIIQEIHQERYAKNARLHLMISDLILDINRAAYEFEHPLDVQEDAGLYQNLVIYIDGHITDELSLDSLAAQFYVSKYHISHLFKENLGLSIHQYILKKRLSLFKDFMRESGDISQAYLSCGFNDYSSFYRAFKKEYGFSPSEYKTQIIKEASEFIKTREKK